jgi:hypothetical protein
MRTARRPAEPTPTTARPVLAIHIDIGQLVAAVRRHLPLSRKAARAIREDSARLFDTPQIVAVSSTPSRKTKATADQPAD